MKKSDEKKKQVNTEEASSKKSSIVLTILGIIILIGLGAVGLALIAKQGQAPNERVVMAVGNEKVYLDEVNLYVLETVAENKISNKHLDETTAEDGGSSEEYYKNQILQMIKNNKIMYQVAVKEGIELTKEEEEETQKDAVNYMSGISGSILKKFGITKETILESYRQRYIIKKLKTTLTDDISVEDENYVTMYFMMFPKIEMDETGGYVSDEDGTPVMLSDAEIKKAKENADQAKKDLDAGKNADDVAKKYKVENYSGEQSNLVSSFSEDFVQYAKKLKEGETSPVIDIESCYAIVQMVSENNDAISQQIMNVYKDDVLEDELDEKIDKWCSDFGISGEPELKGSTWEKLSLYDFTQYVEDDDE